MKGKKIEVVENVHGYLNGEMEKAIDKNAGITSRQLIQMNL
jgi:hypothetical protein